MINTAACSRRILNPHIKAEIAVNCGFNDPLFAGYIFGKRVNRYGSRTCSVFAAYYVLRKFLIIKAVNGKIAVCVADRKTDKLFVCARKSSSVELDCRNLRE